METRRVYVVLGIGYDCGMGEPLKILGVFTERHRAEETFEESISLPMWERIRIIDSIIDEGENAS